MRFSQVTTGYKFLEAGRADSDGALFFSDYALGGLFRLDREGAVRQWLAGVQGIGGMAFNDDGRLLVSGADGVWLLDLETDARLPVLLEVDGQRRCFNDIEADGYGGFYVGTVDLPARVKQEPVSYGELLHVSSDGRCTVLDRNLGAANGIAADPDRGALYLSDTGTGVWRYPLLASGAVGAREMLHPMADSDGLEVDSTGAVWVAAWEAGAIVRIDPTTREAVSYPLPEGQAMTLTFGGPDLRDLFVFGGADIANPDAPATASVYRAHYDHAGRAPAKAAVRPRQTCSDDQPAQQ